MNRFSEKIIRLSKWAILGPKMAHTRNSGSVLIILHNEKGQLVDGNNINGFYQKVFVCGKWALLGLEMAHLHNSGLALRIF